MKNKQHTSTYTDKKDDKTLFPWKINNTPLLTLIKRTIRLYFR